MQGSNVLRLPDRFEHCHNGGSAYETYKSMETKFNKEFKEIELEYMVNLYMLLEHGVSKLQNTVENLAERFMVKMASTGVFYTYPYRMATEFPHTHPRSKEAVIEARKRMELP